MRVKSFTAHLTKNLQFMRVLIKVSGMHLYKIPFQCNTHSKLQTQYYFSYSLLFGQTLRFWSHRGTIPSPVLIKGVVLEDDISQELFHQPRCPHPSTAHGRGTLGFSSPPALRFSALSCTGGIIPQAWGQGAEGAMPAPPAGCCSLSQ